MTDPVRQHRNYERIEVEERTRVLDDYDYDEQMRLDNLLLFRRTEPGRFA